MPAPFTITPLPMSDEAKVRGRTVLVYFKQRGWLTVSWDNRHVDYDEDLGDRGIWCVDDGKNEPYHLRGYCEGDDTHWALLPEVEA